MTRKDGEASRAFRVRVKAAEAKKPAAGATATPGAAKAKTAAPATGAAAGAQPRKGSGAPAAAAETLTLPLAADAITRPLGDGQGAVEILQRLHQQEDDTLASNKLPCAWMALTGKCSKAATAAGCSRCKNGAVAKPALVQAVKAACVAKLLAQWA